ncbi:MAG: glycosyltransferase [Flavihumibacter sp.]
MKPFTVPAKRIIFTINNDPATDQRMLRICTSLAAAGYQVELIGRKMTGLPLPAAGFAIKRLATWFRKGPLSYAEINARIFCCLLFRRADVFCAIDLDTILPVYINSRLKRTTRVYDAHEYFSELREVVRRPFIQKIWQRIEAFALPRFPQGYTVSESIAAAFRQRYGVDYKLIRNVPLRSHLFTPVTRRRKKLLYQGAINEGRAIENLLLAMQTVDAGLDLYGSGNRLEACKAISRQLGLEGKVFFCGQLPPDQLKTVTGGYWVGINLVEAEGLNQYYSLANKFFDYINAGIPQVTMNYPEYKRVQEKTEVAVLINSTQPAEIAAALNYLLNDIVVYKRLTENCQQAAAMYCWENEEKDLLDFYKNLPAN